MGAISSIAPNRKTLLPQFCRGQDCEAKRLAACRLLTSPQQRPEPQAVRSLGALGCTGYPACTCALSTKSSTWDLDPPPCRERMGRLILGAASRLDAFSASPFWT